MNNPEKFWNKRSKNYDKKAKDKTFEQILKRTPKFLKPDAIVLDFACATGLYSFEFADKVKSIHAFDTSSEMIAVAEHLALKNAAKNITFSQTNLFDEKFQEGSFDIILAFNILLYFEDVEKVLQRINDLLKPDGFLITSTACLKEKRTIIGVLSGGILFLLKKIKILPYIRFFKIAELEKAITKSGFKTIESGVLIEKPATEYFIAARKSK
ncbi:methyltransferase domain-containing protein [Maribacter algarum]|uniref:Methyltransferase domain-containing protein n=1 Tax=Maribacter algarum (ex Zhang et al. 2020) TaxID=2578118 RepID=A0A5S3PRN9_9FLAO|nr:class I SAM-dependent methyltransferase [Maribacter algarum]TMM57407.1 methyltransferase domain-containing protein [Maribacter algarum]